MKRILAAALALLMIISVLPVAALAADFDVSVTGDYFNVISKTVYTLAPGATETELVLNNNAGNDRKVAHIFEVDTKNENIEVLPGYYGIDKLDPDNLPLDGIVDKAKYWKAEQLTKTVAYYESMGYNVVGAMNTALAYDSNAPYGYMVWDGVVLGSPEVHKGAQTYLAIDAEGNCELRSMSTPLNGTEVTAISANFDWLVKDGKLSTTAVERTSSDASRSMIGIKADGTLVFCQVDGRNAPFSTGLSNYEMGEMMLALGCVNAVNCDGGGSSTFVSKREGETENTMRSIPSDGSERATINSVILVSKAKPTGEFDHAVLNSEYDYYAPTANGVVTAVGVDAAGSPAELPTEGLSWQLSDASVGTIKADGSFSLNNVKGTVVAQLLYNGEIVGEKTINVVDPDVFALTLDETVLPYGKSMDIDFACTYGADDWAVCVDGAYSLALSNAAAATLEGVTLKAPTDESIVGVNVTATYLPNPEVTDVLKVTYGKGSEIIFDFEDGDISNFLGVDEMYDWAAEVGAPAPIQSNGNYSDNADSATFLSSNIVRNGEYALGVTLDYTDAEFAGWSYNMFFHTGESVVLRDVANGMNATTFGMWVYIPEGAAGLAMQIQGCSKPDGTGGTGAHFYFTTVSGAKKNLNSCTEADIPESRWVYATCDLTSFGDYFATYPPFGSTGREPSFIRFYVKPTTAANLTFYFDDFTLDYSSAVEDRVLPTISNVSYTTQDESVALDNGAVINGNSVSFSAVVADNIKLDNATAKILVDGNALTNVAVSGKYLATTEGVTLNAGVHTVSFEIKDALGNAAKVTRTFTIAGDAVITLGGHNDSDAMPEYGSVYYVDVNAADLSAVNKLTTTIALQTANTWEPQGIEVAEGFKVSYELDSIGNLLTLTVERNGEAVDSAATTLVSVPVRLWVWDGVNHVTDKPITPETQYKTGYCPVIRVQAKVIEGIVELENVAPAAFGGSIDVETKINDIVYAWHYHDAELAVLNQAATCTVNGYEGRTYCQTCQSVIDWGTVIEATGHNYVSGKCDCGATNTVTGLVNENGNWYYLINGVPATGWQMIGTDWYYFDKTTGIGANGDVKIDVITFNFVNGKLTSGVWAPTVFGMRYYYGPGFYNDRGSWRVIDGENYFFDKGVRLEGGYQLVFENQINRNWYYFEEDGTCDKSVKLPDGFYTDRNGYAYSKDGKALVGLHMIDGKYYYFDSHGYAIKNGTYQGVLFKDDYAAYTGLVEKNNKLYYYENGKPRMKGLFMLDGDYYFAGGADGELVMNAKQYAWETNGLLPARTYEYGADGKMLNGIVEKNGVLYYYRNGETGAFGLVEVDGSYYFANGVNGEIAVNTVAYIWNTNGLPVDNANCEFGADGKLLDGIVEKNGTLYYYVKGRPRMAGLVEIDGDYYFANGVNGEIAVGKKTYVWKPNDIVLENADCEFGADGKMLNGIVDKDGTLYYYVMGRPKMAGLINIDGDYYFANGAKGEIATNKVTYVWKPNDIVLENAECEFGPDGKMLDGIVDKNGTLYYYIMGRPKMAGLIEVDGALYFANGAKGEITMGKKTYVWKGNGILPEGTYEFGADGKMLNGIVDKDGTLCYYVNGIPQMAGIIEIDGAIYFANGANGEITVGKKTYVWKGNGILAEDTYEFGADGKLIDGFVTKDDGIYYYEQGKYGQAGLNYIDGYYYFVDYSGKLVTNKRYFAWKTNGLSIEINYTFDELGRIVGY